MVASPKILEEYKIKHSIIWAPTQENLSSGVCKQHWHRPACTSMQSDQCLCYLLIGYHIKTCYKGYFTFLAIVSVAEQAAFGMI